MGERSSNNYIRNWVFVHGHSMVSTIVGSFCMKWIPHRTFWEDLTSSCCIAWPRVTLRSLLAGPQCPSLIGIGLLTCLLCRLSSISWSLLSYGLVGGEDKLNYKRSILYICCVSCHILCIHKRIPQTNKIQIRKEKATKFVPGWFLWRDLLALLWTPRWTPTWSPTNAWPGRSWWLSMTMPDLL